MITRLVRVALLIAILLGVAGVLIGPTMLKNLILSGRRSVEKEAASFVDDEVVLQREIERAGRVLPGTIASLRTSMKDTDDEMADQSEAVSELETGLRLIDGDLRLLADAVRAGQGAVVRGHDLSPDEAKRMAAKLLRTRESYLRRVAARKELIARLKTNREEITAELQAAQAASRSYKNKVKDIESRIALVKAGERLSRLREHTRSAASLDPGGLDRLSRRLDERLVELAESDKLRTGRLARDPILQRVRDKDVAEELSRLFPRDPVQQEEAER
jgi:chromosome segregation ATPase